MARATRDTTPMGAVAKQGRPRDPEADRAIIAATLEIIGERLAAIRAVSAIPLIGFPADEVHYGGCQAGGHGILHIAPDGSVEPCPAAHIAVDSLEDVSLAEALGSPFLEEFRRLKDQVTTGKETCAYADHTETIQAGLAEQGMRQTASTARR